MSCKLEPAIWSRCTGQRIACFDRCQLIIAGMSNIKEVHGKLRLYVSFLEYGRHVGQLRRRRRRRRAYAPTSNTASQDNHEKNNSWVPFIFPLHDEYGAPLGGPSGRRSSAISILISLELSLNRCDVLIIAVPRIGVRALSELGGGDFLARKI